MTLIERFLKYVSFDTQSDDNSGVTQIGRAHV